MILARRLTELGARMALATASLLAAACPLAPQIEPAPEDIKGLSHWFWVNFSTADDRALADAVVKLHSAAGYDNLTEPVRGLLDDLTSDDLAPVEMSDRDPRPAQGMYLVNLFDCTLAKLESVLLDPDQGAIYDQIYTAFERTYTSDVDAFRSRATSVVTSRNYYEAQPMPAARYGATTHNVLRYIDSDPDVTLAHGPILLNRLHMPEPAHYFDTDANTFDLDFQIEVFYEPTPGRVAKFYPFWRHIVFSGLGASTDDNWLIDQVLDGHVEWDVHTADACAR